MIAHLKTKLTGYWKYYQHLRWQKGQKRYYGRCKEAYQAWVEDVTTRRPDVFLSGNLTYGGIRNHLHAIHRYTQTSTEVVPNEQAFPDFRMLQGHIRNQMIQFIPQCRAMHTHVFPWAIEWGRNAQAKGVRWIHTYHLNYFPEHGKAGLEPWQQEINDALLNSAPQADICLSVAKWQQSELRQKHGIDTFYLPNGVDVMLCDQAQPDRFIQQARCQDFLLYVGRHDPVKNPAAFVQLAQSMPEQPCVMVGKGLSEAIIREEYGLEPPANLTILGELDHHAVQDAIAASAAVIVTSYREGLPTLVLEAMTQGKPIVVPDENGCREAIDQGRHGFIYEPDNLTDLTKQTRAALQDTLRCRSARERILREYDWRVIARVLDEIYQEPDLSIARVKLAAWQP